MLPVDVKFRTRDNPFVQYRADDIENIQQKAVVLDGFQTQLFHGGCLALLYHCVTFNMENDQLKIHMYI